MRRLLLVLAALGLMASMLGGVGAAPAAAEPIFKAPWTCGVTWHASSDSSHSPSVSAVDFNELSDGSDNGKDVLASADGTATSHWTNGYGNYVKISHANGWETRYAHVTSVNLVDTDSSTAGVQVKTGDKIAVVSNTGFYYDDEDHDNDPSTPKISVKKTYAPHLHYEQISGSMRVAVKFDGVAIAVGGYTAATAGTHKSTNCDESDEPEPEDVAPDPDFDVALHQSGAFASMNVDVDGNLSHVGQSSAGGGWIPMSNPGGNFGNNGHTVDYQFNADGVPVVFGLSDTGSVSHTWYVSGVGWQPWVTLPAGSGYVDFDVAMHPSGVMAMMLVTSSGTLVHYGQTSPGSNWVQMSAPAGNFGDQGHTLDFEFNAAGQASVFGLSSTGTVSSTWYVPGSGWHSWITLPVGSGYVDFDVDLHPSGTFQAMLVDVNGGLSSYGQSSPGSSWVTMPAPTASMPGTEQTLDFEFNANGVPVVFGLSSSGVLGHAWYTPSGGWSAWTVIG